MAETRGDRNVDVFVRLVRFITRQEADGQTAHGSGATGGVLHHTGESAADEHGTPFRNAAAQLESQVGE